MGTLAIGPPPPSTLDVQPSVSEIEFFRENGYLVVEQITTPEELAWLTEIYEFVFAPENAGEPGAPVDRTNGEGVDGPAYVSQAFFPEFYYPDLLRTTYRRNARRYAAGLLGVPLDDVTSWSHMIRKLPGGREAPWHQDEAYWEPELDYCALGCWLPMHEVTEEMGAMQFVPGSHRGPVVHHHHTDNDPKLHLLVAEADTSAGVVCPLPAGGATFHHSRTLHFTAPNVTDRPRLAYPTEFEVKPTRRAEPNHYSWVDDHRAATGREPPTVYIADGKLVPIDDPDQAGKE